MTTTVSIKHSGPVAHDIIIRVVEPDGSLVKRIVRLTEGEEADITVSDHQGLDIREVGKVK
jgi:hypothetical protein